MQLYCNTVTYKKDGELIQGSPSIYISQELAFKYGREFLKSAAISGYVPDAFFTYTLEVHQEAV